ncbi:alpha/beta fold hydrolase [Thiocystis violacea]|uniref:alpha/beta fold hydrolase n=1 Tax=Thiocystis violacea TaxID=13725 RepID=UPI00190582DB|nr:alpha/beta hydrolase [Thiocystis violacea]MBK1718454.1 alpha/beta hydrolase [Thiocystis violacea]
MSAWFGWRRLVWLVAMLAGIAGCATPSGQGDPSVALAAAHGMESRLVPGAGFRHRVLVQGRLESAARIHVYLEGDGLPWISRHRIASDPTPRNPLALRLMAADPNPAIHVGRPCYHGLAGDAGCSPWLWTHGRYGDEVVESLARAIDGILPPGDDRRVTLIGYSGGGALAVLLAPRLRGVTEVVTIAANLDIDAWTDHQGYSRLSGSLNPADQAPLDPGIRQLHLVGARDGQVPPGSIARFLARNPHATVEVFQGFDHRCCWIERWPSLLGQRLPPGSGPGRVSR